MDIVVMVNFLKNLEIVIKFGVLAAIYLEHIWHIYLLSRQYRYAKVGLHTEESFIKMSNKYAYFMILPCYLDIIKLDIIQELYFLVTTTIIILCKIHAKIWDLLQETQLKDTEIGLNFVWVTATIFLSTLIKIPLKIYEEYFVRANHRLQVRNLLKFVKKEARVFFKSLIMFLPKAAIIYTISKSDGIMLKIAIVLAIIFCAGKSMHPMVIPRGEGFYQLEERSLKQSVIFIADLFGYDLGSIYVDCANPHRYHSNVYLAGILWKKAIIIDYAILDEISPSSCTMDEVVALVAHELAHWKLYHFVGMFILDQINLFVHVLAFVFLLKYPVMYQAFGFGTQPVLVGMILILNYVMAFYYFFFKTILNLYLRHCEFAADRLVAEIGKETDLMKALCKNANYKVNIPCDKLYSIWFRGRAGAVERVQNLQKIS